MDPEEIRLRAHAAVADKMEAERRANLLQDAEKPYPLARAGYQGEAGLLGAQEGYGGSLARHLLEQRRDQLRREADCMQALLDVLPAKVPPQAEVAIELLINRSMLRR